MPFCQLDESQALEKFKLTFLQNNELKGEKELKYFYKQLPSMDLSNISLIRHKVVKFGKVEFTVRLVASKMHPSANNTYKTVLEELVNFDVYACNDKVYATINEDKYAFCANIGDNTLDDESAIKLGQEIAREIYTDMLQERGYQLDDCIVEEFTYVGKGTETYTEYTFVYDYNGEKCSLKAIGEKDVLVVLNEPKRLPKKKFNPLLVIIPVLAIVAIVVGVIMLT